MNKKLKNDFIESIKKVLNSEESKISFNDQVLLKSIIEELQKAERPEEILKALGPIANLLQITIKTVVEIFSD